MTVTAARQFRDRTTCFVGVGTPSVAACLARALDAPNILLIFESGIVGAKPTTAPLSIADPELANTADTIVSVATGFIWSSMPINQRDAPVPVPWLLVILAALFVGGPYLLKRVGMSEGPWLLDFLMTLLDARLVSDGDPAGEGVHS